MFPEVIACLFVMEKWRSGDEYPMMGEGICATEFCKRVRAVTSESF